MSILSNTLATGLFFFHPRRPFPTICRPFSLPSLAVCTKELPWLVGGSFLRAVVGRHARAKEWRRSGGGRARER